MELNRQRFASRGPRPSWSLSKSTHHPKVTSSSWRVLFADALRPLYPGTWMTSASTQTATTTSPTRTECAPCISSESDKRMAVNTRWSQSTLSARQSVPLNLLLEVSLTCRFISFCAHGINYSSIYSFWFFLHRLKWHGGFLQPFLLRRCSGN